MRTELEFDPRRLPVARFAKAHGALEGVLSLAQLPRLASLALALVPTDTAASAASTPSPASAAAAEAAVSWSAQGLASSAGGGTDQRIHLQLRAQGHVVLECQRCLKPLRQALQLERLIRFVAGEDEAARLDELSDDDVLALTPALDLPALIEDELILALPIVPLHGACPEPLPVARVGESAAEGGAESDIETRPNAFAVLAALRRGQPS